MKKAVSSLSASCFLLMAMWSTHVAAACPDPSKECVDTIVVTAGGIGDFSYLGGAGGGGGGGGGTTTTPPAGTLTVMQYLRVDGTLFDISDASVAGYLAIYNNLAVGQVFAVVAIGGGQLTTYWVNRGVGFATPYTGG